MGLSNLKGNGGYIGVDNRGKTDSNSVGSMSLRKYYLERIGGKLPPSGTVPSSNTTVWYDADYVTVNGGNVEFVEDRSGNGINLTDPGSSDRPVYNESDSDFGGKPSISFNTNDFMESIYNSELDITDGFTVYVVVKIDSFPSTYNMLLTRTNGTSWTQGWGFLYYANNWRFWVNNYNFTNTRADMGSWGDFTNRHIFKLRYDKTNVTGEIFGSSAVSEVTTPYTTNPINPSSTEGVRVGDGNSTSYDCEFKLAEFIFYNRPINNNEQDETEDYLKNKYNIN